MKGTFKKMFLVLAGVMAISPLTQVANAQSVPYGYANLDPNNPDANHDGIVDGLELPSSIHINGERPLPANDKASIGVNGVVPVGSTTTIWSGADAIVKTVDESRLVCSNDTVPSLLRRILGNDTYCCSLPNTNVRFTCLVDHRHKVDEYAWFLSDVTHSLLNEIRDDFDYDNDTLTSGGAGDDFTQDILNERRKLSESIEKFNRVLTRLESHVR